MFAQYSKITKSVTIFFKEEKSLLEIVLLDFYNPLLTTALIEFEKMAKFCGSFSRIDNDIISTGKNSYLKILLWARRKCFREPVKKIPRSSESFCSI